MHRQTYARIYERPTAYLAWSACICAVKACQFVGFERCSAQQLQLLGDEPVRTQIHKSLPLSFAAPQHYVFACMLLQDLCVANMCLDATFAYAESHRAGQSCSQHTHACRLNNTGCSVPLQIQNTGDYTAQQHKGCITLQVHIPSEAFAPQTGVQTAWASNALCSTVQARQVWVGGRPRRVTGCGLVGSRSLTACTGYHCLFQSNTSGVTFGIVSGAVVCMACSCTDR